MKITMKYITYVCAVLFTVACYSCSDEIVNQPESTADGTLLNLYIGDITTPGTRLAELGNPGNISNGERPTNDVGNGEDKKNIGLYIYYQDDYSANDLTKPYVRNLECEVIDGRMVPKDKGDIYIYDRMTIVAFYPYNSEVDDYTFNTKNDEKKYPITESDYSHQYYIPYRAQANVNPTNAYYVSLNLVPQQTVKIQVVLISSDESLFPDATTKIDGVVKLVPGIDPQDATGDKRENWVDIVEQPYKSAPDPASSGSHVQRYTSYIWKNNDEKSDDNPHHGNTSNHHDNIFRKGDILLQSDNLTLFFPENLEIREGNVYRYGYNLTTGEMFIPTSDNLIYDAASLASAGGGGYQVCDIDLEDYGEWTPVNLTGTYDGGGHAVKNMKINQSPTESTNVGLFGSVTGNGSLIKNLHLEKPVIDVDFSNADPTKTLNVGGLAGQINRALTEEEIQALLEGQLAIFKTLGLPQSVIDALLADMMKDYTGSGTSRIQGCKVSDPVITVKGDKVVVGGFAGTVGSDKDYKGAIKDSYVSGGSVKVNAEAPSKGLYENVQAGAFAGVLNGGTITNSYTTATAEGYVKPILPDADPEDVAKGFTNIVTPTPDGTGVSGSFTADPKGNTEDGVKVFSLDWPDWAPYTDKWPVAHSTLGNSWGSRGSAPSNYPTLVWETRLDVK